MALIGWMDGWVDGSGGVEFLLLSLSLCAGHLFGSSSRLNARRNETKNKQTNKKQNNTRCSNQKRISFSLITITMGRKRAGGWIGRW
jgi:hypothetical protein